MGGGVSKYGGTCEVKKTANESPNPTRRKTQLTAEPQPVLLVENISWDLTQKRDST